MKFGLRKFWAIAAYIAIFLHGTFNSTELRGQTMGDCLLLNPSPCCATTSLNVVPTGTTYSGNVATVTLNLSMNGSCTNFGATYVDFGDGMTGNTGTTSATTFTIAHSYSLQNVCGPSIFTITACTYTTGVEQVRCTKTATIQIAHPASNFGINVYPSSCNTFIFQHTGSNLVNGQWIYGDGSVSTIQNPLLAASHTYTAAGTYTAYLTGQGIAPCTKSTVITVQELPGSNFTYTVNNGCYTPASVDVDITNYGSNSYQWIVNNTNIGSAFGASQNIATNLVPGTNTISLLVTNSNFCSIAVTKTMTIGTNANYSLSIAQTSCKTFTLQYTHPSGYPLTSAQWNFGDGTNSNVITTGSTVIGHTYPGAGTYVVTLNGAPMSPCTQTMLVNVGDFMQADFTYTVVDVCQPANGIILSIPNYNSSLSYMWQINLMNVPATGATGTYFQNLQNGNNVIKLTITNGQGCSTFVTKNVLIATPLANFSMTSPSVCLGDMLSVFGVNPGGTTYSWTITKPGNVAEPVMTGMNPSYTFTTPGVHAVSLTVTSVFGSYTCTSPPVTKNVTVYTQPNANFTVSPMACNNSVTLTPLNTGTFTSYTVTYGDGSSPQIGTYPFNNAHLSHAYSGSITYTTFPITLIIQNGPCESQAQESIIINNQSILNVNASSQYICNNNPVIINSVVNPLAPGAGTLIYSWTGPNGFTSTLSSISTATAGLYSLTVTSNGACSVSLTATQSLTALADPTGTVTAIDHITCLNPSGSASVIVTAALQQQGFKIGGTTYPPNSGASGTLQVVVNGLAQGANYVTVSNSLYEGCNNNILIQVNQSGPSMAVTVSQPQDCAPGTGSANVTVSPATGTLTWYRLEDYPTTPIATNTSNTQAWDLTEGSYVVKHVYGSCETTQNFSIQKPTLNISKVGGIGACGGSAAGVTLSTQFSPSNISGTYNYTVKKILGVNSFSTMGSPGTNNTYSLEAGNYSVQVTSKGCIGNYNFNIKLLDDITVSLTTVTPTCKNPGRISASASGGDGNYNYTWYLNSTPHTTLGSFVSLATMTAATSFSVKVADQSGCVTTTPNPVITINTVTPVTLLNCGSTPGFTNQGNTSATKISSCQIGSCVQGGVGPYLFEWFGDDVISQTNEWRFRYFTNSTYGLHFIAISGSDTIVVPSPTLPLGPPLADNTDKIKLSITYPYWVYSPGTAPVYNATGAAVNGTPAGVSTNSDDYYKVVETSTMTVSSLLASYSGMSGAMGSNAKFRNGNYNLHVTDANGCKYVFAIGTLTFTESEKIPLGFTYAWGMDPIAPSVNIDPVLHEAMIEASNELLDADSKCMAQKLKQLNNYLKNDCSDLSKFKDALTLSYSVKEHHHTLYYYDRAGRLTKTVPPQGIGYLDNATIAKIKTNRNGTVSNWTAPQHSLATTYEYNSFGQLMSQNTPDGGTTYFIYDSKNRLRFSQNEAQRSAVPQKYSYTKYDALGRIIEVGQGTGGTGTPVFVNPSSQQEMSNLNLADNATYPVSATDQLTKTFYSTNTSVTYYGKPQRYTQNRVSYTMVDETPGQSGDEYYTYYSYDTHGNVEWLVQDQPNGMQRNYIGYEYDLVSGKVLRVNYNEKRADRFFHRYKYDAENRLVQTETSRDGEIWDKDAKYNYYAHGPLKRSEIGEDKVQGLDHIYTLQGWLKAVNSPNLGSNDDPGGDNVVSATSVLERTAADRYGAVLAYYDGDYTTAGGSNYLTGSTNYSLSTESANNGLAPSLYNGNISGWIQSQWDGALSNTLAARADLFRYDILNRIKESASKEETGGGWTNMAASPSTYKTRYRYDRNGNILSLSRYQESGAMMDSLMYTYDNGAGGAATLKNRLSGVQDISSSSVNGRTDLQGTHLYTYDDIGNLIKETGQELLNIGGWALTSFTTDISWTVYGKIKDIKKTLKKGSTEMKETLRFKYDAAGNRVEKYYWKDASPYEGNISSTEEKVTYYVRDAQGNTMATYEKYYDALATPNPLYKWDMSEQPIYGSDRVGQNVKRITLASSTSLAGLQLPAGGPTTVSEYQNWITTTNKSQLLPSAGATSENLCQCRVMSMSNSGSNPNYNNIQDAVEFLGIANNGIAVAEDLNRNLQFYVVLAKEYLGGNDACLVYDKQGHLMKGTDLIGSVDINSKPIIVNIPNSDHYVITHLNALKQPVYHVVDVSQPGHGPVGTFGEVMSANNVIQTYTSATTHGFHFTGIENHIDGHGIVYSSRYTKDPTDTTKGTTEILAYDFGTSTVTPTPHLIYSTYGCGNTGRGELQIAPDGSKLGWYQHEEFLAGFTYRKGEIHSIPLDGTKLAAMGAADVKPISAAGNHGDGSLEFMKNGTDVLYAQRGVYKEGNSPGYDRNIWKYEPLNLTTMALNGQNIMLTTYLFGEIKRGVDGNFYIPNMGRKMDKIHSYNTGWNANLTPPDTSHKMTASLPTQVYKVYDPALEADIDYARHVGSKDYELKDHLGNVRVVLSDVKEIVDNLSAGTTNTVDANDAVVPVVKSYTDYYAFGMGMPGRQFNSGDYRYGYGGHEKIDELSNGDILDFGDYGYSTNLGRRWVVDPKAKEMPGTSPYSYAYNNPIILKDPDGELPILPLLLKAGAAGAADMMLQIGMNFLLDDDVESISQAFEKVDWYDVGISAMEGALPWSVPGGKFGKAAAAATGDVLLNAGKAAIKGEDYTLENATADFFVGFLAQLSAEQVETLLTSKKAREKLEELIPEEQLGIIYERIDKNGKLKPYVGQVKSEERFDARQKEHARAHPDSDFEFKKIDKGTPGKDLNEKEQAALDARGGPTNKSNPNGGTSNKKNVIKKK